MAQHVKILGILHIVFAAFGLIAGIIVFLIFGGIAGLVGAAGDSDAAIAVPILATVGTGIAVLVAVLSLPGFLAGWGLMNFRPWARILTLILSALNLFNIPFGTALAVYAFWVLLSQEGTLLFEGPRYPQQYPAPPPAGPR